MERIDPQLVAQRLREVVADEPKAFAYDVGVSLSAVYNYLNGRLPSTEVLFRIARYTGRPMEWFLDSDDHKEKSRPESNAPRVLSVSRAA
jgi:transcriptional regulator with XRE-family HTH domain